MNLKVKHARFLWVVGVVLALSLAPGCNDNGPSGGVLTPTLTASFASDGTLADNGVGLEFDSYSAADNELTLKVVVQNVESLYGAAVAVEFNPYVLEFLHADLPDPSFLAADGATVLFESNLYGTFVDIAATRQDATLPGVTMTAGQQEVLATITFKVLAATQTPSPVFFSEDSVAAGLLQVTSCPSVGDCENLTDVTFVGGTVTVVAN